jgi:hypothetical protein
VLLDKGQFFKRYKVKSVKLGPKQSPRITTKVGEVFAWRDGKRVGFGTKEYVGSFAGSGWPRRATTFTPSRNQTGRSQAACLPRRRVLEWKRATWRS